MKVFSLATGADTAGIGYGIARAFAGHPAIEVRSMVASVNYIGYPVDVPYDRLRLEELYDAADVVMLHNTLHGHRWYDAGQGKPIVLMHHGRSDMVAFRSIVADARRIGAVQVGSTLDLSVMEPEITWNPAPVDIARLRAMRQPRSTLRVGHAPTNRAVKGTDAFLAAMDRLTQRHPVAYDVIEGVPWSECLERKARCDVYYDQPTLGYGSNAIEAWAMGIPVLAGVANPNVRAAMLQRWGVLPFLEVDEDTMESRLEAIIADAGLRAEYARRGVAHVERWHSQPALVERLSAVFASASPTRAGGRERRLSRNAIARRRRLRNLDAGPAFA